MSRGFSLVELLVAIVITALITAAAAAVVPPLQALFEHTPAVIDVQQRGRTAVDTITQAVRGAVEVLLLDADPSQTHFRVLQAVVPIVGGARGVLAADQSGPGGQLFLAAGGCPGIPDVCGFERGSFGRIAGANGRFDLFVVGSINTNGGSITPGRPFDQSYAVGAVVVEVDVYTFRLDPQGDGSSTLVRQTAAGAVQPIVDRVTELRFEQTLHGRGVDVALTLQPHQPPSPASSRRFAVAARNLR
jgi:prepilin-type N-terminal cleavage/methylation domain-containing protein